MYTAISLLYGQVDADEASLLDDDYYCPNCDAKVVLRNGLVKIAHFAHLSKTCQYAGESQLHLQMKKQIYQYIIKTIGKKVKSLKLEKKLHSVRPDIFIEGNRKNVAIEVQASALTPAEILHRTEKYKEENTYVIWVIPYDSDRFLQKNITTGITKRSVRLKEYEKIIAQMSFNSLLLWDIENSQENGFIAFKLADSFTPSTEYYDRDAGEHIYHNPRRLRSKEIVKVNRNIPLSKISLKNLNKFYKDGMRYPLPNRKIGFYDWNNLT